MEGTVFERLNFLINHYKVDQAGFDMLGKILTAYPDLNMDWLLTGKGSITKSRESLEIQREIAAMKLKIETQEEMLVVYRRLFRETGEKK